MRLSSILCVCALVTLGEAAGAQESATGRIVGRVIDAVTGQGIVDVGVQVVGTTSGVSTGLDGRFSLTNVPAGTVTLHVRRIGFAPKTVTGILLEAGRTLEQNIALTAATLELTTQVVTASAERGTVGDAVDAQRTAVGVVNSVTAEQISKRPDGNAAQAVQRVSGVTVQDNKYVFVRGLGERYTTSSLNGARVPSPEPEKRVVPLDIFPAGLVQSITTTKTFTPNLQGDFSGALVDIKTREFPVRRTWSLQLGGGYESGTTGASILAGRTTGGERLGMVNTGRDLPSLVRLLGNFQGSNLNQGDKDLIVSRFQNAWTPERGTAPPIASASLSFGGNDPILFSHRIGYLFSGTYSSGTDFRDGQVRALADRGNTAGETREIDRFVGQRSSQSVLWGGLANLSTLLEMPRASRSTRCTIALPTTTRLSRPDRSKTREFARESAGCNTSSAESSRFSSRASTSLARGSASSGLARRAA